MNEDAEIVVKAADLKLVLGGFADDCPTGTAFSAYYRMHKQMCDLEKNVPYKDHLPDF